jgi:hypothetical protein
LTGLLKTRTDKARALGHSSIPLLWIKGHDSTKAERAFLTINRAAVQIDPTELKILNAGIAATYLTMGRFNLANNAPVVLVMDQATIHTAEYHAFRSGIWGRSNRCNVEPK